MNILGLHFGHDGSASIVSNGKLVSSISSERVLRKKKFFGVTKEVIDYVLSDSGISIDEIDLVALSDYFTENSNNVLELYQNNTKINYTNNQLFGNNTSVIDGKLLGKDVKVLVIPHHLSHCASAFYTSNFSKSWCFSMDSSFGDTKSNSLICFGDGNKLYAVNFPNMMIGVGYAMFTEMLGIGPALFKAGSTMGLASYGKPIEEITKNIKKYIDESYFNNEDDYVYYYKNIFNKLSNGEVFSNKPSKLTMNIAASIQYLFEECILDVVNNKIEDNGINNLCLSGGSMLNCNSNTRVKTETRFNNVHHFPACGDDGISVGAALYAAHHVFDEPRYNYKEKDICYLGKDYDLVEPDYKQIAKMLSEGKIVAWFMGKSEYGPRALGNRSILADPRNFHNREILNFVVKNREWFRPFAPVVLEEESEKWFNFKGPSPYMLYTADVLQPEKIPAVTHIDNSARMQTINYETNPAYYNIVKEFYNTTGIPILINTSLNGKDEPILETKEDALSFFENSAVDVLVLNGKVYIK